ncbi:hypothetical protein PIB30_024502 [Stylosanthes scabra]|uniref:PB1 domain-containing protein n=1 Tax=Stylosanthes scabra TaxID=79078 RepID=A0ABU6Z6H1_9FABA|nr:hypothetical protein [Stylosanthes scabra]
MEKKTYTNNNNTIKFLYSYGGRILPRSTDGQLRYTGGHTRILTVNPSITYSELIAKLCELCGSPATLKCPLPNGDLETLVSVKNDEDLANILQEYDRASLSLPNPLKIRAILSLPSSLKTPSPTPPSSLSSSSSSLSSSSAARSPFGSSRSSAESPPYAAPHRFLSRNFSPAVYPAGVRSGGVCCCTPHFHGSPRFLYRGPHSSYYCH